MKAKAALTAPDTVPQWVFCVASKGSLGFCRLGVGALDLSDPTLRWIKIWVVQRSGQSLLAVVFPLGIFCVAGYSLLTGCGLEWIY